MYNQKLIFIVLLIVLFLLSFFTKKENFTDKERKSALDGLTVQNKLFNDVFSKINNNEVEIGKKKIVARKGAHIDGTLYSSGDIKNKKINLGSNGTIYTNGLNTNFIEKAGHIKGATKIEANELCLNGVCINKEHLKALKGERDIFIKSRKVNKYLQSGDFTSNVKGKNHSHNLRNAAEFDGGVKGSWEKMRLEL